MTKTNDEVREKNEYARNLRLFVQRLIKMAKEQIVAGRNYGWTQDSMAQELDIFIQERLASERERVAQRFDYVVESHDHHMETEAYNDLKELANQIIKESEGK